MPVGQAASGIAPLHRRQLDGGSSPITLPLSNARTPPTLRRMNQAQQQAIDRVFEILSEHFEHVVIAVGTYDEDKQYTTAASFSGGVAAAIGLCKLYEKKWTKEHLWGPDEE
jgi:hypothetical protein